MFEKALNKLQAKLSQKKDVFKSEAIASEGSATAEDLAAKVVVLFESGDVSPDLDSVKEWAGSEGLDSGEIDSFASSVIDAYFDEGNDTDEGSDTGAENSEEGEDEMNEELQKSMLGLQESQAVIANGLTQILEGMEKVIGMSDDLAVVKSQLAEVTTKKVEKDGIVVTSYKQETTPEMDPKETGDLIMKSIHAGKLSVEEITFFETTGKASAKAKSVIEQFKKEIKS